MQQFYRLFHFVKALSRFVPMYQKIYSARHIRSLLLLQNGFDPFGNGFEQFNIYLLVPFQLFRINQSPIVPLLVRLKLDFLSINIHDKPVGIAKLQQSAGKKNLLAFIDHW
jgi:hypothetical protein